MRHRTIALAAIALLPVACTTTKASPQVTAPTPSTTSIERPTYTITAADLGSARAFVEESLGLQVPASDISYASPSELTAAAHQHQSEMELTGLETWLRNLRPLGLTDGRSLSAEDVVAASAQGLGGLFRPAPPGGQVLLRKDLPAAAMRSVLVHELTHAVVDPLLGFDSTDVQAARTGRGWTTLREFVPLWVEARWQKALPESDRVAIAGAGLQVITQQGAFDVPAAVIRALAAPGRASGEMLSEVPPTWSGRNVLNAAKLAVGRAPADMSITRARYEVLTPGANTPPGAADLDIGVVEEVTRKLAIDDSVRGRVLGDELLERKGRCWRWQVRLRPGRWIGDKPPPTPNLQLDITGNGLLVTVC